MKRDIKKIRKAAETIVPRFINGEFTLSGDNHIYCCDALEDLNVSVEACELFTYMFINREIHKGYGSGIGFWNNRDPLSALSRQIALDLLAEMILSGDTDVA